MANIGSYVVEVKEPHVDWGTYRNPTNREPINGESYVKIPADDARRLDIKRGDIFIASFTNGHPSFEIMAAGNGPSVGDTQYAKQFEGVGRGACKAFTPWYISNGVVPGDKVLVEVIASNHIRFTKIP